MIVTALTVAGTVLALAVLLLMAVSSVLPDVWEPLPHGRKDRGFSRAGTSGRE